MLDLFAFCAGIYLGLNFNVLVLGPFCLLGAGAYVTASTAAGHSLSASVLDLVLPIITVQMGYFLGLTARSPFAMLLARLKLGPSRQA